MAEVDPLRIEFCGEWHDADPARPFTIGREGDLVIDENPYLHRRFLEVVHGEGLWWLVNAGQRIAATISDDGGRFQAWLAPGARIPIVFDTIDVRFSAGATSYALALHLASPPFVATDDGTVGGATTTLGRVPLEGEHLLLVLALAEPMLRDPSSGRAPLPTSAAAATRLGWPVTKFNRKLDHICQKLKKAGVGGLHGDVSALASDRRARLVEYAVAASLVTPQDLSILDDYVSVLGGAGAT